MDKNSNKLISLILEETNYSDKIVKSYREDKELKKFLEVNSIKLVTLVYSNEKVSNEGMGELRPGIPNWFFYDKNEVIKRKLIGRFSPKDIVDELKDFYKLK
jgi:hypothetical protein